jgi:class I fructose-bisphosphate aldolase
MTKRAKEVLDFYRSENAGVLSNIARLINHGRLAGTGMFVILPVDQGFEHGPARSFRTQSPRLRSALPFFAGLRSRM